MAFNRSGPGFLAVIIGSLAVVLLVAGLIGRAMLADPESTPQPTELPVLEQPTLPAMQATPSSSPVPLSTPIPSPAIDSALLAEIGVNELGVIPVIMYHAFVTNPVPGDPWTRTLDDFRSDLQYLYDNDYYIISVRNLLDGNIDVPLGKHPVVLTYDDASARQFQFEQNAAGELVPTADSAVGVLESFFADHPDFGKSSHFAVVGNNCFGWHEEVVEFNSGDEYCQLKLQWLTDHGYEVGNHTWTHENLNLVDSETVATEIGQNALFIDERMQGPGKLILVLTLPFGEAPDPGTDGASYIINGVWYQNEEYVIEALFLVSGGPMYSPFSTWWDPMAITRFNSDDESLDMWFGAFERGDISLYTSDGNPATVTIPDPLPEYLQNELDPDHIADQGRTLITYEIDTEEGPSASDGADRPKDKRGDHRKDHRDTPLTELPELAPGVKVYTNDNFVRLRSNPNTTGEVMQELDEQTELTIVSGPVEADGYIWWEVQTGFGTQGWIVVDFLSGPPAQE